MNKKIVILFIVSAVLASIAGFVYAAQTGGQTINTLTTAYVKKVGDTMTGTLNLPVLNCTGRITGESLTITNTATAGAFSGTNISLGTAAADAGKIMFMMGTQAGDPAMTISPEAAGGITFTTDQSLQPFTFWNTASNASGILVIKGADVTAGNGQLKCNDETDGNSTDIYNSSGNGYIRTNGSAPGELNLQADIKGDVACFGLTNTGDTSPGKKFTVHRKAAEGNNQIDIYIDDARQATITTDATSLLVPALTTNGKLTVGKTLCLTPSATTFLVTADAITVTAGIMQVSGNGQAITLNSTPEIVAGTAGQIVTLIGTSDANTLTIRDEASIANSGLVLAGDQDFTLGQNDTIGLLYNGSKWVELARSSN
jgi:hypothetical protein